MTVRGSAAPRVGLFGILGSGNIGNDASMESVLGYLRAEHPDAVLDALCSGPERLKAEYGIEAVPKMWYQKHDKRASGVVATALKVVGKGADAFRMPGLGTQARCDHCPRYGGSRGEPPAEGVGAAIRAVSDLRGRKAFRDEGGAGQRRGRFYRQPGCAMVFYVGGATRLLPFVPRCSFA